MKKLFVEILLALIFVSAATLLVYGELADVSTFWNAQSAWNVGLTLCWIVVSAGYFHQGWLVRSGHSRANVSILLPSAVFVVQCILFVKGISYGDWSLIIGAVLVNSGVVFCLYQIFRDWHTGQK